jgi:hypothetical protein
MIVLTPDGSFDKAETVEGVDIGFEVNYEPIVQRNLGSVIRERFISMRTAALVCIFLIALLPLYFAIDKHEAYAYVDIDINPSVELEINDEYNVSGVKALNDDAAYILEQIHDLKGKKVQEAIDEIIHLSEENGFTNTAKNVLVGVHYVDKKDVETTLVNIINEHFSEKEMDWDVVTLEIPDDIRTKAEETKKSMNEVFAKQVVTEGPDRNTNQALTVEEKEVLESFYNRKHSIGKTEKENSVEKEVLKETETKEDKKTSEQMPEEPIHPSELKEKNRDRQPGNNGKGNSNTDQYNSKKQDRPITIDKNKSMKEDQEKGKDKGNSNNRNGHPGRDVNPGNGKDKHQGSQEENSGKQNNGHYKNNNGQNKNNNGNPQKGKEKKDGFSYLHPYYY